MALSLEQIKAAAAKRQDFIEVEVPDWGGSVRLHRLGAVDGIALGRKFELIPKGEDGQPVAAGDLVDFYVLFLSASIRDDAGALMFATEKGKEFLAREPLPVLSALAGPALRFNGFTDEPDEAEAPSKN